MANNRRFGYLVLNCFHQKEHVLLQSLAADLRHDGIIPRSFLLAKRELMLIHDNPIKPLVDIDGLRVDHIL